MRSLPSVGFVLSVVKERDKKQAAARVTGLRVAALTMGFVALAGILLAAFLPGRRSRSASPRRGPTLPMSAEL